jgi:hypothetical protein
VFSFGCGQRQHEADPVLRLFYVQALGLRNITEVVFEP